MKRLLLPPLCCGEKPNKLKSHYMDKDSRKVTEEAWLICPNWTEVRRFTKNQNNKDKFFEYMFVDSGIVVGSNGESPPLMKNRKEIKIEDARKEYQQLITAGWQVTEPKW